MGCKGTSVVRCCKGVSSYFMWVSRVRRHCVEHISPMSAASITVRDRCWPLIVVSTLSTVSLDLAVDKLKRFSVRLLASVRVRVLSSTLLWRRVLDGRQHCYRDIVYQSVVAISSPRCCNVFTIATVPHRKRFEASL